MGRLAATAALVGLATTPTMDRVEVAAAQVLARAAEPVAAQIKPMAAVRDLEDLLRPEAHRMAPRAVAATRAVAGTAVVAVVAVVPAVVEMAVAAAAAVRAPRAVAAPVAP